MPRAPSTSAPSTRVKQSKHVMLTYSQASPLTKEECHEQVLACLENRRQNAARHERVITCQEQHKDEGIHFHVMVTFASRTLLKPEHVTFKLHNKTYRPNLSSRRSISDMQQYVTKEDQEPLCYGVSLVELMDEVRARKNKTAVFCEKVLREGHISSKDVMANPKMLPRLHNIRQGLDEYKCLVREEKGKDGLIKQDSLEEVTLWQKHLIEKVQEQPHKRKIMWYWEGEGGAGKTLMACYLNTFHDAFLSTGGALRDVACAYQMERIVIFDMAKSAMLDHAFYSMIEDFKDGKPFSSKFNSRLKRCARPHVIVFSNQPPDLSMMTDRFSIVHLTGPLMEGKSPNTDPKMLELIGKTGQTVTSTNVSRGSESEETLEEAAEEEESSETIASQSVRSDDDDGLVDSEDEDFLDDDDGVVFNLKDALAELDSDDDGDYPALLRCDAIRQEDLDSDDEANSQNAGDDFIPSNNPLMDLECHEDD